VTDGQTDRILIVRPRLDSMQRGKNCKNRLGLAKVIVKNKMSRFYGSLCIYLLQVYGEGSGFDCRKHVQQLNLLRRDMDEQALAVSDEENSMKQDADAVVSVDEPQNQVLDYVPYMDS